MQGKYDYDAYFRSSYVCDDAYVQILPVGDIFFPTGKIIATDPLVGMEYAKPYLQQINPGTYPACICVVPNEEYGVRYACLKVAVTDQVPTHYDMAMTGLEEIKDIDKDDAGYFGFGVDTGLASIMDVQTRDEFNRYWKEREEEAGSDINSFDDLFDELLEDHYKKPLPRYQQEGNRWLNWTIPNTKNNLVLCSSGWGDGCYRVYFGYDAAGKVCSIYVVFITIEEEYDAPWESDAWEEWCQKAEKEAGQGLSVATKRALKWTRHVPIAGSLSPENREIICNKVAKQAMILAMVIAVLSILLQNILWPILDEDSYFQYMQALPSASQHSSSRFKRYGEIANYLPFIWPYLLVILVPILAFLGLRKRIIRREMEKYWEKKSMVVDVVNSGELSSEKVNDYFNELARLLMGADKETQNFLDSVKIDTLDDRDSSWQLLHQECLQRNKAFEVDWKCDKEDFLWALENLQGNLQDKGKFEFYENLLSEEGDVTQWCEFINSKWNDHVIAAMDVDSDSYVLMILSRESFNKAQILALYLLHRIDWAQNL